LGGILLSVLLLYLDTSIEFKPSGLLQYFFTGSAGSARTVLSVISGAMIGIAGTVFSITLVVLTLASSQFGPRLLRNFMHNRLNQTVLGIYLSTYIYCLIILNSVKDNELISFVPTFSVLFAIILTFICVIYLILFIHDVSMSIQPSQIIKSINRELEKDIEKAFSSDLEDNTQEKEYHSIVAKIKLQLKVKSKIANPSSGYLQFIDYKPLLELAKEYNLLIIIHFKPGEYIIKDEIMAGIYSEEEIEDSVIKKIRDLFVTANDKIAFQDAEFAVNQIVEIACKALSPGINDPFTAIACIDYLSSVMCKLTTVKFPPQFVEDSEDVVRIVAEALTFSGMLGAAFHQIRQFGAQSPSVIIRLMESLGRILDFTRNTEQREAVQKHLKMVLETGKSSFQNSHDYADLKERYENAPFQKNT
jgi:uncharacterized membrane protein